MFPRLTHLLMKRAGRRPGEEERAQVLSALTLDLTPNVGLVFKKSPNVVYCSLPPLLLTLLRATKRAFFRPKSVYIAQTNGVIQFERQDKPKTQRRYVRNASVEGKLREIKGN